MMNWRTLFRSTPARGAAVSPSAAASRHPMRRNYAMAQTTNHNNDFFAGSLTADQAVFAALHVMRNRARDLERNHNLTRKFLTMVNNNVIGAKGMRLQSLAGEYVRGRWQADKFDQRRIEDAYQDFSKAQNFSIDRIDGRRLFGQTGLARFIVDGECIVQVMRGHNAHGIACKLIDAELLDHNLNRPAQHDIKGRLTRHEIRMGVEIDENGRPLFYHFLKEPDNIYTGMTTVVGTKHRSVPADQILHIYRRERPGQTRGVTWLASTGNRAKLLDGLETAVTVGFRVAASKMGFFKPGEDYVAPEDKDGNPVSAFGTVPSDCSPGEFWELPNGLDFQAFDPDYPNANFDEFKKSITRELAAGFGVSYPELGNDFAGVSYSAGQIGVQADMDLWANLQQFWIEKFEEPVFNGWLDMALTTRALDLPASKAWKFRKVKFVPPRRKHIDPLKTHKAQSVALADMSRDPFDIASENGQDFEDVVEGFQRAVEMLEERNLPIPTGWGVASLMEPDPDPPEA